MNEEERKAIELIGGMVKLTSDYVEDRVIGPREVKALCIILDLIKRQQEELEQQKGMAGDYKRKYEDTKRRLEHLASLEDCDEEFEM